MQRPHPCFGNQPWVRVQRYNITPPVVNPFGRILILFNYCFRFFNITEAKSHQKPHLLDEKQQFIKVPCIPWIIKNPSNWSEHDMRCEIGTKCCVLAHGVLTTGDWRSLPQRLTFSPTESDITINFHKTIIYYFPQIPGQQKVLALASGPSVIVNIFHKRF